MHSSNVIARLPQRLRNRAGNNVSFDSNRIKAAILKAGHATEEFDEDEARLLTTQVIKVLSHLSIDEIEVERIQDIVEQTLIAANHLKTARAYIAYREKHQQLRSDKRTLVDVSTSINEYLEQLDWRVNANANQGYSLGGLILNSSGKMIANYWLSHVYPPEVGEAHRNGDIHIHDLDM
ncbi:MAG: ribonucleoside triphosphate reductase, partial [Gammaproteobacteria bacterium]|nr:ribonucleoside triphosphate reductase [Gammaproteobacteria bacterium]